jgi:hypothetical protein
MMRFTLSANASTVLLVAFLSGATVGYAHDTQTTSDTYAVVVTDSGPVRGALGPTTITFLGADRGLIQRIR